MKMASSHLPKPSTLNKFNSIELFQKKTQLNATSSPFQQLTFSRECVRLCGVLQKKISLFFVVYFGTLRHLFSSPLYGNFASLQKIQLKHFVVACVSNQNIKAFPFASF